MMALQSQREERCRFDQPERDSHQAERAGRHGGAVGIPTRKISTQLFITPRTAGWHLRTVFAKLGTSSRRELRQALPGLAGVAVLA